MSILSPLDYDVAIGDVFGEYPGTAINLPALAVMAVAQLHPSPEEYDSCLKQVKRHIRQSDKYLILSGKCGGVYLIRDIPKDQVLGLLPNKLPKKKLLSLLTQLSKKQLLELFG